MPHKANTTGETHAMPPLDYIDGYPVRPGFYNDNGAIHLTEGVSFTIHSRGAASCTLLLFPNKGAEPFARLRFPDHYRIGDVFSMIVYGLRIEDFEYAYQMDGPYDKSRGLLFDKNNYLLDPYARAVTDQRIWGMEPNGKFRYKARVVRDTFDWGNIRSPNISMRNLVIYELHVRGFTQHSSSGVNNPGTFAGLIEKIPYLKELGVNAVELMPIFEFDEMYAPREHNGRRLIDYWGYNPVCFFAPNTGYTSEIETNREGYELKTLIKALKENGIEVILDVVFNHTAEGDHNGKTISFKGIDNNVYYILDKNGDYYNFSGCGNTLNCNHPIVKAMILESLRYWVVNYRIDGFRFDLASILGRNEDGSPMENPPLLQALAFDPILRGVKLVAEAWDAGGLYQVGTFPSWNRWAEWNGKYRDDMRSFLKGDGGLALTAARRITGSEDIYPTEKRGESASVNFITCHDGFTLIDLYSYSHKHNEANGWNNTDGSNDNRSWNCGIEGGTDDNDILNLRHRLCRNACAALLMSRGTPMFLAGDEFLNTQHGNNNPYCQDNEISWLDWSMLKTNSDMFEFWKSMIALRMKHDVIRGKTAPATCGFADVSVHGITPRHPGDSYDDRYIGVMYAGRSTCDTRDDIIYVGLNMWWQPQRATLPALPEGLCWCKAVNTWEAPYYFGTENRIPLHMDSFGFGPRSVAVFIAETK